MQGTAAGPLYFDAQLPTPHGMRIVSTTSHFSNAVGRERIDIANALRDILELKPSNDVFFAGQNHGSGIEDVFSSSHAIIKSSNYKLVSECDALTVTMPGTAVVVRTADCVPLVLSCSVRQWVSVIHAGWRGTLAGITEKSIDHAIAAGIDPRHLHLWIGPRIQGNVYEVSRELADEFDDKFKALGSVTQGRNVDLGHANSLLAQARGVPKDNISISSHCTFSQPGLFPSYRRDGECRGQIYTAAILLR